LTKESKTYIEEEKKKIAFKTTEVNMGRGSGTSEKVR
jgi:hypothetical protein